MSLEVSAEGELNSVKSLASTAAHSGWLVKQGGRWKTWKKRFFVLKSGWIKYYKSDNVLADFHCGSILYLEGCRVESTDAIKYGFELTGVKSKKRGVYIFKAASEADREQWLSAIKRENSKTSGPHLSPAPVANSKPNPVKESTPLHESPKVAISDTPKPSAAAALDSPKPTAVVSNSPHPATVASSSKPLDFGAPKTSPKTLTPLSAPTEKLMPTVSETMPQTQPKLEETKSVATRSKRVVSIADVVRPSDISFNQNSKWGQAAKCELEHYHDELGKCADLLSFATRHEEKPKPKPAHGHGHAHGSRFRSATTSVIRAPPPKADCADCNSCVQCGLPLDAIPGKISSFKGVGKVHAGECRLNFLCHEYGQCAQCGGPLMEEGNFSGDYFETGDLKIHVECKEAYLSATLVSCDHCGEKIQVTEKFSGAAFSFEAEGAIVHKECREEFQLARAPECVHCHKKILGESYALYDVDSGENTAGLVHSECFAAFKAAKR